MYQYSTSDIRTKVSINFANMSEVQLHQLIRILASCRNVCAHNERLYSFQVNEAIPDMILHSKLKLLYNLRFIVYIVVLCCLRGAWPMEIHA